MHGDLLGSHMPDSTGYESMDGHKDIPHAVPHSALAAAVAAVGAAAAVDSVALGHATMDLGWNYHCLEDRWPGRTDSKVAVEVGWSHVEQPARRLMFQMRWVFGAAHVLHLVGSVELAARSWRSNSDTGFVDYRKCNMKTYHEGQRRGRHAGMAHFAGIVADPGTWMSRHQMDAAAVESVTRKARTVSEWVPMVLVVLAEVRIHC